jgi:hypothetical protein
VEITFHERVLTISGERKAEEQKAGSGYHVRERRHGTFRRSLVLPHNVQEDRISARFEDGVLGGKGTGRRDRIGAQARPDTGPERRHRRLRLYEAETVARRLLWAAATPSWTGTRRDRVRL